MPLVSASSPTLLIVMGVAGSGKTTVGSLLAERLGWPFFDADDFHPESNLEKMRGGMALSDADRLPWLERLRELIADCLAQDKSAVLACSALKESYRRILAEDDPQVRFVFLQAAPEVLAQRLEQRTGHFFIRPLLDSQLSALETPADALTVDASRTPEEIVQEVRECLL